MSKSLKNFSTIKEYLSEYNYWELWFLFLLNQWDTLMDFNPESSLEQAQSKDFEFKSFFRSVKQITQIYDIKKTSQKFNQKDFDLQTLFYQKKEQIHSHLCDNFNTLKTINSLSELVSATSIYMKNDNKEIKSPLLREIAKYVRHILGVMGFVKD